MLEVRDPLTEFTLDPAQPLGVFAQTRSEHIGYTAEYYKVVKVDGVQQERTRVNRSNYQASCRKVTIGVAGATPEQINAINAAIATGDDATVQGTVSAISGGAVPAPAPAPVPETAPTPETTPVPETTPAAGEPGGEI